MTDIINRSHIWLDIELYLQWLETCLFISILNVQDVKQFSKKYHKFVFIDTPGLGEGEEGNAIDKIIDCLSDFS